MTDKNKTFTSNERNYSFGISQKAIIYDSQEGKYLLLKSKDRYYSEKYGPWDLAGGTVNPGETAGEALKREINEEVGEIDYEIVSLIAEEKILNSDGKEKIFLGNLVKWLGGKIKISDEHTEYKWESYKNIIKNKEHKDWLKNFIIKAQKYIESQRYLNGWKRCQADFENYKKQQVESQKDIIKYSTENIVTQILPVLDNFQMSMEHIPEEQKNEAWVQGVTHIQKQLETVLADNGVEKIKVRAGDDFNPEIHEAIISDSNDANKHPNDSNRLRIKKVILKGYKIEDKIIRPARVIVK